MDRRKFLGVGAAIAVGAITGSLPANEKVKTFASVKEKDRDQYYIYLDGMCITDVNNDRGGINLHVQECDTVKGYVKCFAWFDNKEKIYYGQPSIREYTLFSNKLEIRKKFE